MGEIINPNSSPEIPVNSNTVNQEITTSVRTVEPGRSDNESNEQSLFGAYRNQGTTRLNNSMMNSSVTLPEFTSTTPNSENLQSIMNRYQPDPNTNVYLPNRNTPYYNLTSNGYESLDDFEEAERDMDYLKQLYPRICQILQAEIEDECDRLEYEGSYMFDQYPDKITLDRIIHRIYERVKDYDALKDYDISTSAPQVSANQLGYNRCQNCNLIEDFARILFLNEIHNRRRRYRSRKRWFY